MCSFSSHSFSYLPQTKATTPQSLTYNCLLPNTPCAIDIKWDNFSYLLNHKSIKLIASLNLIAATPASNKRKHHPSFPTLPTLWKRPILLPHFWTYRTASTIKAAVKKFLSAFLKGQPENWGNDRKNNHLRASTHER